MKVTGFARFLIGLTVVFLSWTFMNGLLGSTKAFQENEPPSTWTLLIADQVMTHPDKPILSPGTVLVKDAKIRGVREGRLTRDDFDELPANAEVEVIDLGSGFLLPGLIDCHTHITFELNKNSRLERVTDSDADAALKASAFARRTLEVGFTTLRNVGSSGDSAFALRDAIAKGYIQGPRILVSGSAITPTGGHADGTLGYVDWLFPVPKPSDGVADGADECRKAVRHQVKRGADLIKLTATGGVLSNTSTGTDRQFFDDELEAIVSTAHLLGRKVAAHAHGSDGINAALSAGVDSIEHGSYLDEESIQLFLETQAFLVPTLLAGEGVFEMAEGGALPPPVAKKAREVGPVMISALRRASRAGVRVAFGTDSGVTNHGRNGREFELMEQAGMEPLEIIRAATINAAELCDILTEVGSLDYGKKADIIAASSSPLESISALKDVVFVMRDGQVVVRP